MGWLSSARGRTGRYLSNVQEDRTVPAWRLRFTSSTARGWGAMEQAKAQFAGLPYLHFPKREQRWLQAFPEFAREASGGRPIGEWIRESYDPQVLAQWLDHRLGPGSFRGIYP